MTATLIFQGVFLWLTSSVVAAVAWSVLRRAEKRRQQSPVAVLDEWRVERDAQRFRYLEGER